MEDLVECYSGSLYAERPATFIWQGQKLVISTIVAQWLSPERRCFRVITQDEQVFELSFSFLSDQWEIHQL
jgi:hypothetical protein